MDNMNIVCASCERRILSHSRIMTCVICHCKYHIQCIPLTRHEFEELRNTMSSWFCSPCNIDIFPCNHIDDGNEFLEALHDIYANNSLDFERINNMIFNPFSSNDEVKLSTFETDPDINFYTELNYINMKSSNYYSEDQFVEKFSDRFCPKKAVIASLELKKFT